MKHRLTTWSSALAPRHRAHLAAAYTTLRWRRPVSVTYEAPLYRRQYPGTVLYSPGPTGQPPEIEAAQTIDIFCWEHLPQPADLVLDIGAGTGSEALTFSRLVGPGGVVLSVEAHPVVFEALTRTLRANGVANVICAPVAVSDSRGQVRMEDDSQGWLGNSIVKQTDSSEVTVQALRLDDLLDEQHLSDRRIALLKMNIEGAELLALQGADATLERTDHLAISCHDFKGQALGQPQLRTYREVMGMLQDRGFTVTARRDPRPYVADVVYATRP